MVKPKTIALEAWRVYVRNRDRATALATQLRARSVTGPILSPKYSIVSAVYNVDRYLDQYFRSIVIQREFLSEIQLIVVNDGSTDGSRATLEKWRRRFPNNIIVLDQENAGQAAARNTGLECATGTWVTFIDPDDFIERDYFTHVARFIEQHDYEGYPLNAVQSNKIFYFEKTRQFKNDHPLRYRFNTSAAHPIDNLGLHLPGTATTAILRRSIVTEHAIRFDRRLRPNFEDGHFMARFLLACPNGRIGFVRGARYYYRKRSDTTSTLDTSLQSPSRYNEVYEHGYIAVLKQAATQSGTVPQWLQRQVLYDIIWQVRHFCDADERLSFLTSSQLKIFRQRLEQAFEYIEPGTICGFELASTQDIHRVGLLGRYKKISFDSPRLRIESASIEDRTFVASWYTPFERSDARFFANSKELIPIEAKVRRFNFLREPFVHEHRVRLPRFAGHLKVFIDAVQADIHVQGVPNTQQLDLAAPFAFLGRRKATARMPEAVRRQRNRSQVISASERYRDAWILIDRDVQADDSAEVLYRYLRKHRPDINAFFALRPESEDWSRLSDDGFRLLKFGGDEHAVALLNAKFLISSHADIYVTRPFPAGTVEDILKYKFVFLQHGVIKDDLSKWLNGIPIDLLLTSSGNEYDSIAGPRNSYSLLPSQVALTGLPRHDALLDNPPAPVKRILIVPTWRDYLVGRPLHKTSRRAVRDDFADSKYAKKWGSFLRSERLFTLAARHGYEVAFFPHLNIEPYINQLQFPNSIKVLRPSDGFPIRETIRQSKIMITDYSSVAFEMALLERSLLYYQFDKDEFFGGGHASRPGHFDYERDGFGPVCLDEQTLLDQLERTLARDGAMEPEYARRAQETFAWRDGKNCERVVAAIERLNQPFASRAAEGAGRLKRRHPSHEIRPGGPAMPPNSVVALPTAFFGRIQLARARRRLSGLPPHHDALRWLDSALQSWQEQRMCGRGPVSARGCAPLPMDF